MNEIITLYNDIEDADRYRPFDRASSVLFRHLVNDYYLPECDLENFKLLAEAHGWKVTILI